MTDEGLVDNTGLWWHLIIDHGMNIHSTKHGDPVLMHATAHISGRAFGLDPGHSHEWDDGSTQ